MSKDAKDGPVLISLHALLTESDAKLTQKFEIRSKFLSTLSLRRATPINDSITLQYTNFYPRSPCGERQQNPTQKREAKAFLSTLSLRRATAGAGNNTIRISYFYPRSPCGERPDTGKHLKVIKIFLSTLSLRRATRYGKPIDVQLVFLSTLSLRRATAGTAQGHTRNAKFLSTLSLRRATNTRCNVNLMFAISIHALLAESDSKSAQNSRALLRI